MSDVSANPTQNVLVSIIIPCYNESKFIDSCLRSVYDFEPIAGAFEVLVIDGMSKDGTRDVLARWCAEHPNLRMLDNPAKIVPNAMNIGIRAAQGAWIVRLDAHSEYPANYLRLCIETSQRTGADNVGGVFITVPRGTGREAQLVRALTTHKFGVGDADFRLDSSEGPADTVPYGCYQRAVFDRIGWYDERLVRDQDYELNRRLSKAGGQIWLNPAIQIKYYNQGTLRGLLRQAYFTAQWNAWMWYLAPYTFSPRHAIPGAFVAGLIIGALSSLLIPILWIPFLLVVALYALLAIGSGVQQSRRYGLWMLPILPFLFLAYHLAYGAGTLWGGVLLAVRQAPVQHQSEPWPGAGYYRVTPSPPR